MSLLFDSFYNKYLLISSVIFEIIVTVEAIAEQAYVALIFCSLFNIFSFITGYFLLRHKTIGAKLIKIRSIVGIVAACGWYLLTLIGFRLARNEMFQDVCKNIVGNEENSEGFSYFENLLSATSATGFSVLVAVIGIFLFFILALYVLCQICIYVYYKKRVDYCQNKETLCN